MSANRFRVRPAELDDLPELAKLARQGDLPVAAPGFRHFKTDLNTHLVQRLADILDRPDRTLLVATDASDEVVGMVLVSDDEVGAIVAVPVLLVSNLMVAPRARHRGVGRSLLASVVALADERAIEHVVTSSAPTGRETSRYLARLGFLPLTSRRIAPTAMLRRVLGPPQTSDRVAMMRRARIVRSGRAGFPVRPLRREA